MNKEKLERTLLFFKDNNIELPIDVKNAIEDVFSENDNVNDVDIYFKEDVETLENDITISTEIDVYLDKQSSGTYHNIFTYYGEVEYSVSEFVKLYKSDDQILENITDIDNSSRLSKINQESYAVILIEFISWGEGNLEKKPRLFIYCPENSGEEE
jgi:hypothetical protein